MNQRSQYFHSLLASLQASLREALQGISTEDAAEEILHRFDDVLSAIATTEQQDYLGSGQDLLSRIISHYPQLTPAIHRDLLWFFGGDCLHFLTDQELDHYQNLEERYYQQSAESGTADYRDLRAQEFGLH